MTRPCPSFCKPDLVAADTERSGYGLPNLSELRSDRQHHRSCPANLNVEMRTGRTDMPVLRVYCSQHTHSSIDKACITLGLGSVL